MWLMAVSRRSGSKDFGEMNGIGEKGCGVVQQGAVWMGQRTRGGVGVWGLQELVSGCLPWARSGIYYTMTHATK